MISSIDPNKSDNHNCIKNECEIRCEHCSDYECFWSYWKYKHWIQIPKQNKYDGDLYYCDVCRDTVDL